MGTIGRIVDGSGCIVLVDVNGELVPAHADVTGMMVIDEPTLLELLGRK